MKNGANFRMTGACAISTDSCDYLLGISAVNIEIEVFVLDFLVFAVGTDRGNRCVDAVKVFLVAFAHCDTNTVAEVFGFGERRAYKRVAFAGVGFQEAVPAG